MSRHNGGRVLAIGLDAAEPKLIRRLIEQDEMPVLKALLAEGRWMPVHSPAHIGSGAIWPTFLTGKEPPEHGIYGEWCWQPETMSLFRFDGRNLKPFWKTLSEKGISVGVLDPPFARFVGLSEGFEIIDWGAHDSLEGRVHAGPKEIADFLAGQPESHPFSSARPYNASADDSRELGKLTSQCLKGVKLRGGLALALLTRARPDFAFIVFPEIHHSAHHLWPPLGFDPVDAEGVKPMLKEICREVDRQIGILIEAAGSGRTVLVFSLHGMRPTAGVAAFLQPLLCEKGFARLADWKTQSWAERAHSFIAAAKRHTPEALKKVYYNALTPNATRYLARPTMLPPYDWARTRAFSLPSDQHGWIRINLQGRERAGIVSPEHYDDTCRQLEELMRSLCGEDGRSLVRQVIRTAANSEKARSSKLPDLVVHWADSAFAPSSGIQGSAVKIQTICKKFTGQHAIGGFCILSGGSDLDYTGDLLAKDMHLLIAGLLGLPRLA